MDTRRQTISILLAGLVILALPAAILAEEPTNQSEKSRVIIIGDDQDEVVIDLEAVDEIVAEALAGVEEVMAELEDMQFQMRLGQDNRLDLSYEDTTFELDLDQILTQVAAAVQVGFHEFDTGAWTHQHGRHDTVSENELRRELDQLKEEIADLRRELGQLETEED